MNRFMLKKAFRYIERDPDKNIPKLLDLLSSLDQKKQSPLSLQVDAVRNGLTGKNSNWYNLLHRIWTDVDTEMRKTVFENLVLNSACTGASKALSLRQRENCNIPWAILMDPTSACNLNCTGCWAKEYGGSLNLTFEELDNIISQGKSMGTYVYLFTGGEPLMRKKDILSLCQKHSDCIFSAFTNATLIDVDFADEILKVKNFIPAISIEGFQSATDKRRGIGTFEKITGAMKLLKEKKIPFGVSCCYTRENVYDIGSSEFFDFVIDSGAFFMWLFTYMPVGENADTSLIATAPQREYMYYKVRKYRKEKSLFTIDFWNDGEYVGGCIAGGRSYLHINAGGDIEPCAFIHYSDSNIREHTLLEAYKRPLFMEYRNNQPFNDNMLRPCPLLDNKDALKEMVLRCGAHSTEICHPEDVSELCKKCHIHADLWQKTADNIWGEREYKYRGPR